MTTSTTHRFSAHYCERLRYNWVDFYSQILSRNFDTGWILCHISVVFFPIPFKPQKGTPMMVTPPTCQISSNSFRGLPCRRDRPSTFIYAKNRS